VRSAFIACGRRGGKGKDRKQQCQQYGEQASEQRAHALSLAGDLMVHTSSPLLNFEGASALDVNIVPKGRSRINPHISETEEACSYAGTSWNFGLF
jgi:hypothetical protein